MLFRHKGVPFLKKREADIPFIAENDLSVEHIREFREKKKRSELEKRYTFIVIPESGRFKTFSITRKKIFLFIGLEAILILLTVLMFFLLIFNFRRNSIINNNSVPKAKSQAEKVFPLTLPKNEPELIPALPPIDIGNARIFCKKDALSLEVEIVPERKDISIKGYLWAKVALGSKNNHLLLFPKEGWGEDGQPVDIPKGKEIVIAPRDKTKLIVLKWPLRGIDYDNKEISTILYLYSQKGTLLSVRAYNYLQTNKNSDNISKER